MVYGFLSVWCKDVYGGTGVDFEMFGFFFGDVRVSFWLCGFYLPPQLVVQKGFKISTTSHLSGLSVDL